MVPERDSAGSRTAEPDPGARPWRSERRLGTLLALLLVLTSLANGAPLLMARIGLIAPQAYWRERQAFCPAAGPPGGLVSACPARRRLPDRAGRLGALPFERLHAATMPWRPWKLSRLVLLLGLPLAALIHRGRAGLPGWRRLAPALPLLFSSALAALISVAQPPPAPVLLVSLLPLLWLAPMLAAGPFTSPGWLAQWARAAAWLLWLQLPLLLLEAWRGLPMPFGPLPTGTGPQAAVALPTRLLGSFSQPNSLGVAALLLLGFALSYRQAGQVKASEASASAFRLGRAPAGDVPEQPAWPLASHPRESGAALAPASEAAQPAASRPIQPGLWLAALICVLLARSATGLLGWLVLLCWCIGSNRLGLGQDAASLRRWVPVRRRLALTAATTVLVLLLCALPQLLGRPDLWRSPLGRWQALADGMAASGPLQWLFGQGLAANSNQLLSLLGPQAALHAASSDGMPVLLLLQSGLVGVAAFYGLLLWAWRRDQTARPFLLTVGLASLTLNITELFPINLLLGLCLAGLLAAPRKLSREPPWLAPQSIS